MHKTIGIIGGMTPESTMMYYETIIQTYIKKFGDYSFPEIVVYSVSFQQYVDWMNSGNWNGIAKGLCKAGTAISKAGADFGMLATNTMHKVIDQIMEHSPIPFVNIIDAVAEAIQTQQIKKVGLLGTRFTMVEDFYKIGLEKQGIHTIVPNPEEIVIINDVIFQELGKGVIKENSKKEYLKIINRLQNEGAEGIILGCTEIPLLIKQEHCSLPLFDTTTIHAEKGLEFAILP